jgi:hypothetical protein
MKPSSAPRGNYRPSNKRSDTSVCCTTSGRPNTHAVSHWRWPRHDSSQAVYDDFRVPGP